MSEGITVLSLFDGMSCGMIALDRLGIKVKAYYASEIDKHAIKVSKHNWPNIIHIGDVTKVGYFEGWLYTEHGDYYVGHIDLLIGGSPCQGFSFAGKQLNFEDPRSKLFFEFVRLKEETECTYFMLENVVMKQQYQDVITEHLGVTPVFINSALISAQTRKRLYWSNLPFRGQPEDKNTYLKDILLSEIDEKFIHSAEAVAYMCREVKGGRSHWDFKHHHDTDNEKASCITAVISKGVPYNVLIDRLMLKNDVLQVNRSRKAGGKQPHNQDRIYDEKGKCVAISAAFASRTNVLAARMVGRKINPETNKRDDHNPHIKTTQRLEINSNPAKTNCLTSVEKDNVLFYPEDFIVRRLTPIECERLQTVPDGYTAVVADTKAYKMLGNGWTVDVICHLLKPLLYGI